MGDTGSSGETSRRGLTQAYVRSGFRISLNYHTLPRLHHIDRLRRLGRSLTRVTGAACAA